MQFSCGCYQNLVVICIFSRLKYHDGFYRCSVQWVQWPLVGHRSFVSLWSTHKTAFLFLFQWRHQRCNVACAGTLDHCYWYIGIQFLMLMSGQYSNYEICMHGKLLLQKLHIKLFYWLRYTISTARLTPVAH